MYELGQLLISESVQEVIGDSLPEEILNEI